MSSHTVKPGDTFDSIARKEYGTESRASLISRANPGVALPLIPGTVLAVPNDPQAPKNVAQSAASQGANEVAIEIDGQRFRAWDQVSIVRSLDTFDTIEFRTPFEPSNMQLREKLRPFSYKDIRVLVGGEPLFSGKLVGVNPTVEPDRSVVVASAYSLPGVLNDCTIPVATSDSEFLDQNVFQIAQSVAEPFGVSVEIDGEPGAVFEREAIPTGQRVYQFLMGLAKQRGLVMSSTPEGALLLRNSVATGDPVAKLGDGISPVMAVSPLFNEQEFYSHITGVRPAAIGVTGENYTEPNVRLSGVTRPFAFTAGDTDSADIKAAVQAKMGRMFANSVRYSVPVPTWRDANGELWAPNTSVILVSPRSMVYSEYEFIIRSVDFFRNDRAETAVLTLMLPGGFAGEIPERMPWD